MRLFPWLMVGVALAGCEDKKAREMLRRACELGDRTSCLQIDMVKR